MPVNKSEILDAAGLVFGDEEFLALDPDEVNGLSTPIDANDVSRVLSGSAREAETYDPRLDCLVTATEFYGLGQDDPASAPTDARVLILTWENNPGIVWVIDLDTGECIVDDEGADVSAQPDWRAKIIGTLSLFADKKYDF